jgi:DnaJ family protein C protein 13
MIEKIASHIADFSPRLQSNTRALYQYCPIPIVNFPQLENELFCNIYYLKHLCDTQKFPDWPIKDPVRILLRKIIEWITCKPIYQGPKNSICMCSKT